MWQIHNPEIRTATLDFGSSDQGLVNVSQLYSDDVQLINAIELVEWDTNENQVLVCEACGFVQCKPGDWVSLRRAEPLILVLPAFDVFVENEKANDEYSPPWYISKKGTAYFDPATYESLQANHSALPPVESIRGLNMREAILIFQWEAPCSSSAGHRNVLVIKMILSVPHLKEFILSISDVWRNLLTRTPPMRRQ